MHPFMRVAAALLSLALGACGIVHTVPTNPNNYSIEPKAVSHLRAPQTVALKNAYAEESTVIFPIQHNKLSIEQKELTQTAIAMLSRALEKQGITTAEKAEKTVTLRVRAQGYRMQMFRWTGRIILEARLGEDPSPISYPNESLSPKGWENAFDGAVLFALNDLIEDERFVAYINR
jgi:hypothetical protein